MAGIGQKLWEMGKSPPQHLNLIVFGLIAVLTGLLVRAVLLVTGTAAGALPMVASALLAIGGFFLALALFLGAYVMADERSVAWRIAQLIGAVLILLFVR